MRRMAATSIACGEVGTRISDATRKVTARAGAMPAGKSTSVTSWPPRTVSRVASQGSSSSMRCSGRGTQRTGKRWRLLHPWALPCTSLSTSATRRPRPASAQARLTASVLLPAPPFMLLTAMTWPRRRNGVSPVWLIPLSPACYPVLGRDRRDGAMTDFPRSLPEFGRRFPDEAACAEWLLERRWGSGFACPACGHDRFWRLGRKVLTLQCRACRRETSVTAGTVMHRSHLPLKVWFTAAWLVATHRNGMSARQLWLQLGPGSHKSAWLLLRKLRAARGDPNRDPLGGLVEVDETSLSFRRGGEPARPGWSH